MEPEQKEWFERLNNLGLSRQVFDEAELPDECLPNLSLGDKCNGVIDGHNHVVNAPTIYCSFFASGDQHQLFNLKQSHQQYLDEINDSHSPVTLTAKK